ncbi:MAG: hypothetical protein SGPRY_010478 [Prymnesium sp.]
MQASSRVCADRVVSYFLLRPHLLHPASRCRRPRHIFFHVKMFQMSWPTNTRALIVSHISKTSKVSLQGQPACKLRMSFQLSVVLVDGSLHFSRHFHPFPPLLHKLQPLVKTCFKS